MKPDQSFIAALVAPLALGLACAPAAASGPLPRGVTLVEDPLEHEATLSTRKMNRPAWGVLPYSGQDTHLLAHVDRRSGAVRFEVRQALSYTGPFREYRQANFETGGAPGVAMLRTVDANKPVCNGPDQFLSCVEVISFPIDEASLRRLAVPGAATVEPGRWSFKFKPVMGQEYRDTMPTTEIASLLRAVDDYRRALPAPEAAAPVSTMD